ncbi:MAG: hypothetical protein WCI04_03100 [archaeon]
MVKTKTIVSVSLILAVVLFFSIIAFGFVPEYVLGKSSSGGQVTDLKTQKPTITQPQTNPVVQTPPTNIVTPNPTPDANVVLTPVTPPVTPTPPVQTPPRRVTRAS